MKVAFPKNLRIYLLLALSCAFIAIAAQFILFPVQYTHIERASETELGPGLTVEIRTPANIIEDRPEQGTLRVRSQFALDLIVETSGGLDVSPGLFGITPEFGNNGGKTFNITASDVGDKILEFHFSIQRPNPRSSNVDDVVSLRTIYIPITVVPTPIHRIKLSLGIFVPLLAVLLIAWKYATRAREHERRIDQKVEQAESKALAEPEKAKYAWDVARINLEAYFERNRTQVSQVFIIAVIVMSIGFILVCFGVYLAMTRSDTIKPALVAGISGIITQFIGATFMVIYRSTMTQANEFMVILERINTVGMAVQVLDSIPESETALKNESRTKIVELLLSANISTTISTAKKSKAATA